MLPAPMRAMRKAATMEEPLVVVIEVPRL